MTATDVRRWFAVGTGVGLEIGREDLDVTVARVRPSGIKVLGALTIGHFREQPAAEWGTVYGNFLRKLGHGHLAATVLLPRDEVIVRQVQLPGVADKDMAAALRFQIDSLHPFSEDEAVYDFARVGKSTTLVVGITRKSVVDEYTALFAEAGLKVSAFTFSAACLYSALRLLSKPPVDGFLAMGNADNDAGDGEEAYGESPRGLCFRCASIQPIVPARWPSCACRPTLSRSRWRMPCLSRLTLPRITACPNARSITRPPRPAPAHGSVCQ